MTWRLMAGELGPYSQNNPFWGPFFKDFVMQSKEQSFPENNLAKLGHIVDMKLKRKENPSIFLATFFGTQGYKRKDESRKCWDVLVSCSFR